MPIVFVSGDLFDNAHGARAFAHGCNCQGSMGAGIAKTLPGSLPRDVRGVPQAVQGRAPAVQPGRLLALEGRGPALGLQPGHPGGLLAGEGQLRGDRGGPAGDEGAGRRRGHHEHRHPPDRRRLRRAVVEEGAGDRRGGVRRLGGDAGGLRGVRGGRVGRRHPDRRPSRHRPEPRPAATVSEARAGPEVRHGPIPGDGRRRRTRGRWRDGRHPLLQRQRRVRLLLELLAAPDRAQGQDLADERALLPGPEVRRDARRGGGPAGEVADDRRPDGPQPQEAAPQGLGVGQGPDHARGGPGQVHPARRPAGDPAGDRRREDRRAHRERRLLGRRRRRQRQEHARPDPHAGAGGVARRRGRAS